MYWITFTCSRSSFASVIFTEIAGQLCRNRNILSWTTEWICYHNMMTCDAVAHPYYSHVIPSVTYFFFLQWLADLVILRNARGLSPWRYNGSPLCISSAAPDTGQHTLLFRKRSCLLRHILHCSKLALVCYSWIWASTYFKHK